MGEQFHSNYDNSFAKMQREREEKREREREKKRKK